MFSYAYTDAYSASSVLDPDFGRVVGTGDPLINIPKHNANVLVLKDIDFYGHNLRIGGGLKYVSSRLGETGANFFLPAYTLGRALATYDVSRNFSLTPTRCITQPRMRRSGSSPESRASSTFAERSGSDRCERACAASRSGASPPGS